MAQGNVTLTAQQIKNRKKRAKRTKIIFSIIILLLMAVFVVLSLAYNGGSFTVTLDPNFHTETGLAIYDDEVDAKHTRKLYADELKFMDNISIDWLPKDINKQSGGSHNGDNYIAYTFYVDNQGTETQSYWYSIYVDDVIKSVDEAIRIMVILNDERTVYAKPNPLTGEAEKGTEKFYETARPVLANRNNFKPGEKDKFTIVIWLEGDDPECIDNILGGEIKLHMDITEEHIEEAGTTKIDENKNIDTKKETKE